MRSASLLIKLKSPSFGIAVTVVIVDAMIVVLACWGGQGGRHFFREAWALGSPSLNFGIVSQFRNGCG